MKNKIITADDFGLNPKVNKAIVNLFLSKKIDRVSLLTNMPASKEAASLAKKHQIPTGLHFNLIEGKPLSKDGETLVNKKGYFHPLPIFLVKLAKGSIDKQEIENELKAQIKFFRHHDLNINHFNSHQNIHLFKPVFQVISHYFSRHQIRGYQAIKNRLKKFPLRFGLTLLLSGIIKREKVNSKYEEVIVHPGTNYDRSIFNSFFKSPLP